MIPQRGESIKGYNGLMSSRGTSIAIGVALAAFLCVCMLAIIAIGAIGATFLFGVSRQVVATNFTPLPPLATPTPLPTQTADDMNAEMDLIEQQVKDVRGW